VNPALASIGVSFQTALWWGWVALAAIASASVLAWLYRRLFTLYPQRQALTLVALKISAVLVLLLSLLRPALFSEDKDLANARVILLVDDSRSMSTRDGSVGQPRIDDARRVAFDTLLPKLKDKLAVTTLAFSDRVKATEKAGELTGTGDGTDIPNALLESARNYVKSGSVGAYLLVTDGGDARALPPAFSAGAPVFAVSIGSDLSNIDDLRIGEVEHPDRVDSKTDFDVRVDVSAAGRPEFFDSLKNLELKLSEGKTPLSAKAVALTTSARKQTLTLRISAAEQGIHRYTLALPVLKSEVATLNNERTITVEVQDPSLRVLYYASRLGQGYKPLRNAIKTDAGIHITGLVRVGSDRFLLQGEKPDDKMKNEFPTSTDILKKFKCVVLGDCEAKDISPAALTALEQYVSDGGSLVALGGPLAFGLGGWANSPLSNAFPWQIAASEPPWRNESIPVELTPLGRAHPIFKDLNGIVGGGGNTGKMNGYNTPGSLRPGAQALVNAALPSGERPAVVAFSRYGKGKVLGIASHALWLWSDTESDGGKAYSAFWRQAIRFLAGSEDSGGLLNLAADKQGRYAPGSQALVSARVLDRSLVPLKGATLNAALKTLDGAPVGTINFREDGAPGAYSAQVDLASAGAYRLQVSASDSKGVLETRELLLEAGAGSGEGAFPAVNTSYLQELTSKTGGALMTQDHADELAAKILDGVKAEVRRKEISLVWDNPYFYLVFLGLMTAEWIVRRRMNMI
jgi:uncharacterized membrane protein